MHIEQQCMSTQPGINHSATPAVPPLLIPAFSRQSFPKSFCCTFSRDLVQPPGDRAWRRKGEKKSKQEWILLNRARHFSQSLIMFRPDWRWNCTWREGKPPPLGQSRGPWTNLISSSVEDGVWFGPGLGFFWFFCLGFFVCIQFNFPGSCVKMRKADLWLWSQPGAWFLQIQSHIVFLHDCPQ